MSVPRCVLIVEDDLAFAEFLRAAIESLGHRAVHVGSGAEALDAFKAHRPDLIFLDLLLPKKDGFKVAEEIRAHAMGATIPIAMMTGIYRKAVYEKEGRDKLHAAEYLIKPFGVREIWRVLERHLGAGITRVPEGVTTVAARGSALAESPLACQLAAHLEKQSDGVLFVRGSEGTFVVYLRAGAPIFARSSNAGDRLDRVLVKAERATEEQVAAALEACAESRGRLRLGEALVERNILSREDMTTSLQLQLRLILNRLFQVETGHCLFVAGEHPTEEDVLLAANPREVILRGARMTSTDATQRWLPSPDSVLSRANGWESLLAGLNLRDDEARLLQLADGATTIGRFLACASVAGFDGPRILLGLCAAGLVSLSTIAARATDAETMTWDAAPWKARPIGAVITELHRLGATGRLCVLPGSSARIVIDWQRGSIVFVESAAAEHRLGPMIERMELLDAATLAEASADLGDDAPDAALGRALVDRGCLGPAELYWAAVYQAQGAVHSLLEMGTLPFEWTDGPVTSPMLLPDVPTIELAWNGIRSLEDSLVRELLPPDGMRLADAGHDLCGLPLADDELAFARRLIEGVDVTELLATKDADARRTALGLTWLGHVTVTPVATSATKKSKIVTPPAGSVTTSAPAPALALSLHDDLEGSGDFLDMLHGEAYLTDSESTPASDAEFLEPRLSPPSSADTRNEVAVPARVVEMNPAGAVDIEALVTSINLLARRLNDLRPTVRTLRGGLDGEERRVLVDRARMAELFDGLLEAIGATSQVEDLLERWQADAPTREELDAEPVGAAK